MTTTNPFDLEAVRALGPLAPPTRGPRSTTPSGCAPSDAAVCPRVVAGKRCVRHRQHGLPQCICRHFDWLLDHVRIWHGPDGHVLTAEPYAAHGRELGAFIAECAGLGLDVMVTGGSEWAPGATFLITVSRSRP